MATVAQLLRVLQVAMATSQTHHECLGVVKGRGLVVQAVGVDGGFNHVELLQLAITIETNITTFAAVSNIVTQARAGGDQN